MNYNTDLRNFPKPCASVYYDVIFTTQINQLIILRVFGPLWIRPEASNPFQVLSFWFDTIEISQNIFVVHFSPKKN